MSQQINHDTELLDKLEELGNLSKGDPSTVLKRVMLAYCQGSIVPELARLIADQVGMLPHFDSWLALRERPWPYWHFKTIWSEEDQEFVGLCDEFPSLSHLDKDEGKALEGIKQLIADVVEDMIENGEPLPESKAR